MKVVKDYPPNFEKIKAVFPVRDNTVYTYRDVIFAPKVDFDLPDDLIAHESVHMLQQGEDPAGWWDLYLVDPEFRFRQELEAYKVQYKAYLKSGHRDQFQFLLTIARDLSGELYGNMTSLSEAIKLIKS